MMFMLHLPLLWGVCLWTVCYFAAAYLPWNAGLAPGFAGQIRNSGKEIASIEMLAACPAGILMARQVLRKQYQLTPGVWLRQSVA